MRGPGQRKAGATVRDRLERPFFQRPPPRRAVPALVATFWRPAKRRRYGVAASSVVLAQRNSQPAEPPGRSGRRTSTRCARPVTTCPACRAHRGSMCTPARGLANLEGIVGEPGGGSPIGRDRRLRRPVDRRSHGVPNSGYLRVKVVQEQTITRSALPYTIVRATQFPRVRRHDRRVADRRPRDPDARGANPATAPCSPRPGFHRLGVKTPARQT